MTALLYFNSLKEITAMQRYLLIFALASAAMVAGNTCPASAASATTPARVTDARHGLGPYAGLAFVSDQEDSIVWVCPTGNIRAGFLPPTEQLQGVSMPVQLAVDSQGTVYVANAQIDGTNQGAVTVYPRGQTTPSRTLSSGLNTSTGVAVDSSGTVFVSNKYSATIEEFANGSSSPTATIRANLSGPDGLAIDRAGNLFVADGSGNNVLELEHGSLTPRRLALKGLSRPAGVAVDSRGTLYVSNLDGGHSNVAVYPPGSDTPSRRFVVPYSSQVPGAFGESTMLSIGPGDMLIASASITLIPSLGELFGGPPVIAGFATGQSQPQWSAYGLLAWDTVFQVAR